VGLRSFTHVSYKLTAESVNADTVGMRASVLYQSHLRWSKEARDRQPLDSKSVDFRRLVDGKVG
jgi:hypothetical protein